MQRPVYREGVPDCQHVAVPVEPELNPQQELWQKPEFAQARVWLAEARPPKQAREQAVQAAWKGLGGEGAAAEIVHHDHFDGRPQHKISLSHTRTLAAVAAAEGVRGLGLDIEFADRRMRAGATRHFLNAEDDAGLEQQALQAWVAKEAAFKALDPHCREWLPKGGLLLSKIWLRQGRFGLLGQAEALGTWQLWTESWQGRPLLLGLARLD